MSESEETKWRIGAEPEESDERAADLSSEENENKEELQQKIQTKAEEIGGGGEGSLITRPEEVPINEAPKRESDFTKSDVNISKQLERQADQLARIEKVLNCHYRSQLIK
jgi:hypothetical protein